MRLNNVIDKKDNEFNLEDCTSLLNKYTAMVRREIDIIEKNKDRESYAIKVLLSYDSPITRIVIPIGNMLEKNDSVLYRQARTNAIKSLVDLDEIIRYGVNEKEETNRAVEGIKMKTNSIKILKQLQTESGLMRASHSKVNTGYDKAWLRDNIYESLGFEAVENHTEVMKIHRALLDILLKHEYKIDHAIVEKPDAKFKYIHARFNPLTFEEFAEDWGNKQNDAIGAILFKIGDLESKGITIIRDDNDERVLQKLVYYLSSIKYWEDKDNGIWEENEEVHASSVGACVAGLKKISLIVDVPEILIEKGLDTLHRLLPKESETKEVDLALLSLIYPYNVVNDKQRDAILKNVENKLVKNRGVMRYIGDQYYNKDGEAEWTFGFPWLAIIYKDIDEHKYSFYLSKTKEVMNEKGEMPELYFSGSNEHNENSPLGWAQAMYLVAEA